MTTDRFDYHRIKPSNYNMIIGFLLALLIHGILLFAGRKLLVTPVQYGVQSDDDVMVVDLVAGLLQSDADAVEPIISTTEQQPETVKIMPKEELATLPQPDIETVKPLQQKTAKTMPRPSQGTVRTKSKPGYFQNRPPRYPPLAKKMHQEGLVVLSVSIDQKGMPVKVEVEQSSGYQLLDQAALKAVKHWTFQPERIGGLPVESRVSIPVRFRLEEPDEA